MSLSLAPCSLSPLLPQETDADLDELFEGLDLEDLSEQEELLRRIAEEKHVVRFLESVPSRWDL